jgi:hypothetical protein
MVAAIALTILLLQAPSPVRIADDRQTIPEPKERRVAYYYDYMTATFFEPLSRLLDIPRDFRKMFGSPKEAENINALDDVPDSSWYTMRNFWNPMPIDKIREGTAVASKAPDTGKWTLTKCKSDGVMPGFQIKDHKGDSYLLKFDPPSNLELATAADVIGSRFLYAAGYNVPANYIVTFVQRDLEPKPGLSCTGPNLEKLPLTPDTLTHFLENVPRTKDGKFRAMASLFIAGKIKGPFSYQGVRKDDPNDRIRHEHRREIRALRMIQAFINNVDVKQLNTLDSYVEENGRKFLKHYLIDFGDSLGSASTEAKEAGDGHEYIFDMAEVFKSAFTLGIHHRADTRPIHVQYPSLGYIEGSAFEPKKWKQNVPNTAFANMTDRDGFWAAKIVAAFTDEQIAAAVSAGQYSNPLVANNLVQILKLRRDRMADYWFRRFAPLDHFRVSSSELVFDDLAITANRDKTENVRYDVIVHSGHTVPVSKTKPGQPIPVKVTNVPSEVVITRISQGWPVQTTTVVVQLIDGKPEVTRVRR